MGAVFPNRAWSYGVMLFGNPIRSAILSFILTAIVFLLFSSGLYPFISFEWNILTHERYFSGATIFTIFDEQYNWSSFRPLDKLVWSTIAGAYKAYGTDFYWIWLPTYSLLVGLLSALIFGITYILSRKIVTGLLAVIIYSLAIRFTPTPTRARMVANRI